MVEAGWGGAICSFAQPWSGFRCSHFAAGEVEKQQYEGGTKGLVRHSDIEHTESAVVLLGRCKLCLEQVHRTRKEDPWGQGSET